MPEPREVPSLIPASLTTGACLLLVLSKPRFAAAKLRANEQTIAQADVQKVSIRPLLLKGQPAYQFTLHFRDRVTHENLAPDAAARRATALLEGTFQHAALYTSEADFALRARPHDFQVTQRPPSKSAAPATHDRIKAHLIPDGVPCPFLAEIGVMTPDGRVRAPMQHKFRQINRFLELVQDVVPALPRGRTLRIVDFGCGKSYLTFALHHLLTVIHELPVEIVGLDRKADVIADCRQVAAKLNCHGLEFREGDIETHAAAGPIDLAVSLHACDTATDDALAKALAWECAVILAVPCCQHELAPQIRVPGLEPLQRHGLLHERFATLATDALRAAVLEICGYQTQVVEFIDLEHTPKNVLIRAIRKPISESVRAQRLAEYRAFKAALGLGVPYLETAVGLH